MESQTPCNNFSPPFLLLHPQVWGPQVWKQTGLGSIKRDSELFEGGLHTSFIFAFLTVPYTQQVIKEKALNTYVL